MLAIEICYALLKDEFECGAHPLPEGADLAQGYVTYQDISTMPQDSISGWLGFDQVRMQINVYDKSKLKASHDANRIKRLFTKENPYSRCSVVAGRSDFDTETMLHLQQIDFYMYQSDNNC